MDANNKAIAAGESKSTLKYRGYEYDEETKLYYLNCRMYDPSIARFLQEDTYRGQLNDPLSLNLYTYCDNNPVVYVDPTGHYKQDDGKYSGNVQKELYECGRKYAEANNKTQRDNAAKEADAIRRKADATNDYAKNAKTKIEKQELADGKKLTDAAKNGKDVSDTKKSTLGDLKNATGGTAKITLGIPLSERSPSIQALEAANLKSTRSAIYPGYETMNGKGASEASMALVGSIIGLEEAAYKAASTVVTKYSPPIVIKALGYIDDLAKGSLNKLTEALCFTAPTLILTDKGYVKIVDIKVGDKVFSENIVTGEKGFKSVKTKYVRESSTLVIVNLDKERIETTEEHPFWVIGRGWVKAKNLHSKDLLKLANGRHSSIKSVEVKQLKKPILVYNFEVVDWHTYHVSSSGVLVHNNCFQTAEGAGNSASAFEKLIYKMPANERVAAVKTKFGQIVEDIGLVKDKKLTKLNGRDVYRNPQTGEVFAVDTQHGRFEVLNPKNGKHMGEVDIDFKPTKPADTTGKHDIKMK